MMFDWDGFLARLRSDPPHFHRILPPCSRESIGAVEQKLGVFPRTLVEMHRRFNGAEIFIAGSPLVTFFRVSSIPPISQLEWAPEWCIDEFTAKWRAAGFDRESDWAIAMTNYGGLVLIDAGSAIKEWDTGLSKWISGTQHFGQWIEKMMSEGAKIMAE